MILKIQNRYCPYEIPANEQFRENHSLNKQITPLTQVEKLNIDVKNSLTETMLMELSCNVSNILKWVGKLQIYM